ncbi:MAG: phytanoyl-CoA dioxygenase family protein [Phycisphaerae bacterium]
MTLATAPEQTATAASGSYETLVQRAIAQHTGRTDRYRVTVPEYVSFRTQGFLVVPGLLTAAEVGELRQHTEDLMQGRLPEQRGQLACDAQGRPLVKSGVDVQELEAPPANLTPEQKAEFWLRIHMLHYKLELHERYLLQPRVLDVLEALIGPDVLALQSMLFLKGPGKPGQGYHQDSYYIPTFPDTLCGAWIAIDDVDEENGCMWFTPGSHNEPVYPPQDGYGFGDDRLEGIAHIRGVSETDESKNDLTKVAAKYAGREICAPMKAGDVAFFGGHVLHRSHTNRSKNRFRRSFVGHYCNARSYTNWGKDWATSVVDPVTGSTNGSHILARGDTHLAFSRPRFGTPCAALLPQELRQEKPTGQSSMMGA